MLGTLQSILPKQNNQVSDASGIVIESINPQKSFDNILQSRIEGNEYAHHKPQHTDNSYNTRNPETRENRSLEQVESREGQNREKLQETKDNEKNTVQNRNDNEEKTASTLNESSKDTPNADKNKITTALNAAEIKKNEKSSEEGKEKIDLSDLEQHAALVDLIKEIDTVQKNIPKESVAPELKEDLAALKEKLGKLLFGKEEVSDKKIQELTKDISALLEKFQKSDAKLPEKFQDLLQAMKQGAEKLEKRFHSRNQHTNDAKAATQDHSTTTKDTLIVRSEGTNKEMSDFSGSRDGQGNSNNNMQYSQSNSHVQSNGKNSAGQLLAKSPQFQKHLNSVMEQARVVVRDSKNANFSVKLHPRSLGSLNVNLSLDQGVVVGRFLVETNEARDALLSQLDQVKQQLEEAGVSVGEFQVGVNDQRGHMADTNSEEDKKQTALTADEIKEQQESFDALAATAHYEGFSMVI